MSKKIIISTALIAFLGASTYFGGIYYEKFKFNSVMNNKVNNGSSLLFNLLQKFIFIPNVFNSKLEIVKSDNSSLTHDQLILQYPKSNEKLVFDNDYSFNKVKSKISINDEIVSSLNKANPSLVNFFNYLLLNTEITYIPLSDNFTFVVNLPEHSFDSISFSKSNYKLEYPEISSNKTLKYSYELSVPEFISNYDSVYELKNLYFSGSENKFSLSLGSYKGNNTLIDDLSVKLSTNVKLDEKILDVDFSVIADEASIKSLNIENKNPKLMLTINGLNIGKIINYCREDLDISSEDQVRYCLLTNSFGKVKPSFFDIFDSKTRITVSSSSEINKGKISSDFTLKLDIDDNKSYTYLEKFSKLRLDGKLLIDKKVLENKNFSRYAAFFIKFAKDPSADTLEFDIVKSGDSLLFINNKSVDEIKKAMKEINQ